MPMMQMMTLFAPAVSQPCQSFFPRSTVDTMVNKQDTQSSLNIWLPGPEYRLKHRHNYWPKEQVWNKEDYQ